MTRRPLVASLLLVVVVAAGVMLGGAHGGPAAATEPTPDSAGSQTALRRPAPIEPGSQAFVRDDGSCLRLRSGPGLQHPVLTCLAPGSSVQVLFQTEERDGYRWQAVLAGRTVGWVADYYLEPIGEPPACTAARGSRRLPHGPVGTIPAGEGAGWIVWGGGSLEGLVTAAAARGCALLSVWTPHPAEGRLIGHYVDGPTFLNREWSDLFPDGRIPTGTILAVICRSSASGQAVAGVAAAGNRVPAPAPWADAPRRITADFPPATGAAAVVVVDEASGALLYGRNAQTPLAPASLTKIATAIVAIEGSDLDAWTVTDVDSRALPGTSVMGLQSGDCFQLRDLLWGLLLPSGNDAALALGRAIVGSDAAFVDLINARVARLGLTATSFVDAHGLGGPEHLASAYDIAMLARYAMQLPAFAEAVAAPARTVRGSRVIPLRNGNRFLSVYPGADGVKTGYTEEAGLTFAASVTRDGHRLFVVLLDAPDRYDDAARLLDWAFANYRWP